jgi:hypothetical protein
VYVHVRMHVYVRVFVHVCVFTVAYVCKNGLHADNSFFGAFEGVHTFVPALD